MFRLPNVILCLLLVWSTCSLHAQIFPKQFRFNQLTVDDGLASNETTFTFQDTRGLVWICTYGGLNRYDGNTLKSFLVDKNDSTQLHTVLIQRAAEDKNGDLWFATLDKGVAHFDRNTEIFTHYTVESTNKVIPNNRIVRLISDHRGDIWYGTSVNGVGKITIEKGGKKHINIKHFNAKRRDEKLNKIYEDAQQRVWILNTSLKWIDNSEEKLSDFKSITAIEGRMPYYDISESPKKRLFVSNAIGYYELKPAQPKRHTKFTLVPYWGDSVFNSFDKASHTNFIFTSENKILVTSYDYGMFSATLDYTKQRLRVGAIYRHKANKSSSLVSNNIRNVMLDNKGVVWLATQNNGVSFFDLHQKQFMHIRQSEAPGGLKGSIAFQLFEDKYENLWVSVRGAPLHYLENKPENKNYQGFTYFNRARNGIGSNYISSFEGAEFNGKYSLIVGSFSAFQLKDYKKTVPANAQFISLLNSTTDKRKFGQSAQFALAYDSVANILWIGSYAHGYSRSAFDSAGNIVQMRQFMHDKSNPASIPSNTIRDIYQDNSGTFWFATNKGLAKLISATGGKDDAAVFKNYLYRENDSTSIPHHSFLYIYEDKAGTLWLGSLGGGLIKASRNKAGEIISYKSFTTKQGFPDNVIKGILEDKQGNLWVSSGGGLSKFNPQTEVVRNYTKEDGLQSNNFRDNSCLLRKNGQMVFGGLNGMNVFYPDSINDNPFLSQAAITDFKVFGKHIVAQQKVNGRVLLHKAIEDTDTITLSYKENVVEFSFSALHYATPQKNKLKYRLKGFDKTWVLAKVNRPYTTYTNLDGGTYTFEVMAANNDGVWNESVKQLTLIVLPPWWETLWFKFVLSVLVAGVAVAYYIYRMRSIKAENDRLEELVALRTKKLEERTDEVLMQNEEIKQQAEELLAVNEQLESQKDAITHSYNNIKQLGEFGQEITSVLNVRDINTMIGEYIGRFMHVDAYGLVQIAAKRGELLFIDFFSANKKRDPFSVPLTQQNNFGATCLLQNKAIVSGDIQRDYPSYIQHSPEVNAGEMPNSVAYLPLVDKQNTVGLLVVHSQKKHAFGNQELGILNNLASYLSIALTNAKSYEIIQKKNLHINNSINYAQTIQKAILPLKESIAQRFGFFSVFLPKDVVSGDFYWFTSITRQNAPEINLLAVIDCTGHGVPGAIMSIVSNGALNRIVKERMHYEPAAILEALDDEIHSILQQDQTDNNDGMDVCLCSFIQQDDNSVALKFAAAKRPLFVYESSTNSLLVKRGTRRYIGGQRKGVSLPFETTEMVLQPNDVVYLSSDGFVDQNSPDRNRYGTRRFKLLLQQIGKKSMQEQQEILHETFEAHKKDEEQRDDVTIVGLRVKPVQ